ncbi:unnamed protein product [Oppiella nova]|uniref:Uncharacterized protein n=1 Tax=Oppiella nova TaxID=334625 RepID=A0A7R9MM11_9ACAR|nr:unnamed protein product [Oppiella nova]CAG2179698.1 unnamed protein product [Oppiella nova]
MWSKGLNDSFSAISGHISTLKQSVNQSLIGADATDAASAERRRLVAEVALLRREVRRRHRREASPPAQSVTPPPPPFRPLGACLRLMSANWL